MLSVYRFYWSVNLGALISYTLITYICQYGIPWLGGATWGFFIGYSIPLFSMIAAVAIFLSGWKRYKKAPPGGSVLCTSVGVLWHSLLSLFSGAGPTGAHFVERASSRSGGIQICSARYCCFIHK